MAMHTTRRSLLMFAGVVAITAVSPRRAFSQLLPTLPPALADVKALLRAATKVAMINVNGLTQVHTQVLKCGELKFASNAVLEFAALDFDWIALYADVIKLTGAATVRRINSINIDGAPGADGSDAPPTPPGYGANGFNGKAGGPGREGGFQRVPTVYIFCQQVLLNGIQARPSDVGGPRLAYPFAFQFDGYDGGKGGDGGNGGDGGDGNQGSPARSGWIDCSSVPGWGGRGGDGGRSGTPGKGGDGTDGSAIYAFVRPSQKAIFDELPYSNQAGRAGINGRLGTPGRPGKGGLEGLPGGNCGTGHRHGPNGDQEAPCALQEFEAHNGVNGPAPTVTAYTGFAELA